MLFKPTAIHDDEPTSLFGERGSGFVDNSLLKPDGLHTFDDSCFDDGQYILSLAEHVHKINCAWHSHE